MSNITYHIIIKGHFSHNGNFIGEDHEGLKIHVYKKIMDRNRLKSVDDISFPLYAIGTIKVFAKLTGKPGDADREILESEGKKETFERLTAFSIFKNFEELIDAYAISIRLNKNFNDVYAKEQTLAAVNAFYK